MAKYPAESSDNSDFLRMLATFVERFSNHLVNKNIMYHDFVSNILVFSAPLKKYE